MAKLLKLRRGTTTQHGSFTGAEGELTIDTTKDTAVVHDGSQAGGRPLLREDLSNLPAGTIDNADVNASAAIAGTKISPDFGSQDITTTGKIKFANVYTNESDLPNASTYHGMFAHVHSTGHAYFAHGGAWHKLANISGADFTGNISTTGNITVNGTVDGIDVAARDALFGNLTTTNGVLSNGVTATTQSASDNSTKVATTAYTDAAISNLVDSSPGALNTLNELAAAINDDANFSTTVTNNIATKLPLAGGQMTGDITFSGSQTVDGRDVSADGTKLDGIESGATADQTATEIVSLVNGQTITPAHIHVGTGRIGGDNNDYIAFADNANMDVVVNGSTEFRFEADGDFHADGDIVAFSSTVSSDKKLKENIEVIPNALEKVQALNGVSFTWKRDGTPSAGVIAQEVQAILPEAVKEVTPVKGGDSHLSVNYHALTSILIESIKELKAEIEELKGGK